MKFVELQTLSIAHADEYDFRDTKEKSNTLKIPDSLAIRYLIKKLPMKVKTTSKTQAFFWIKSFPENCFKNFTTQRDYNQSQEKY